ncbi:MAG: Gfo/Idh/MocA family oxidoreductase [Acidobacteria bacterium]|nr:Gfo/Idh/MocA family oxidoreductase [Acidobacteriota bacterium]
MKEKIRIGIIGTGFARSTQIPAFLECPDAEVVSIASGSIENAKRTAEDFGIGHFTDDWRETVTRDDIDLISITTPPNLHHEMSLFAIEHGKHILCEKPMAMNVREAREMTERASEKGILALIDHELRFLNGRRKAYKMIRRGEIGKIIHFKQMFRNASRGTPGVSWNWWSDIDSGGGALGAIGSHAIDAFEWFTGSRITEVFCMLKTNVKERIDPEGSTRPVTTDDEANMILTFADSEFTQDASGTASFSVVEAGRSDFSTKIFGTEGSIMIGESGELWFAKMGDKDWKQIEIDLGEPPPNTSVGGWSRGFMNFAGEIVLALKDGKTEVENAATFEDGLRIQKVLEAARRSNTSKTMVKV